MVYEQAPNITERFPGNEWVLPTDIQIVSAAEEEFGKRLTEAGWNLEEEGDWLKMSFREALINAIAHGNLGVVKPDNSSETLQEIAARKQKEVPTDKKVYVNMEVTPERVLITIRDEGAGFDWRHVADPREGAALLESKGRGIFFMRNFFDSVVYNEAGNEVTMTKTRPR